MPDFERLTRSLALHVARDDRERLAYLRGRHEGMDRARREAGWMAVVVALVVALVVGCVALFAR